MMGHHEKLKGGDEYDAFTRWRKVLSIGRKHLRWVKRKHNKRIRKLAVAEVNEFLDNATDRVS